MSKAGSTIHALALRFGKFLAHDAVLRSLMHCDVINSIRDALYAPRYARSVS